MDDFITMYRKVHGLDEEWEKDMRKKVKEYEQKKEETPPPTPPKQNNFYGDCDHPNTMENSTATIFYIVVMIGGAIFNDRLLIWIVASVIYFTFITRHQRRKK